MKNLFKSGRFKVLCAVLSFLLVGAFLSAVNGHGETAQSSVIGTIFTPAHWVAGKISDGIDKISSNARGDARYEAEIDRLEQELGELQDRLIDYNNLKSQNEIYKQALELKEDNPDFKYLEACVIGRDSANPFNTFTINKGLADGVTDGDAVLYGKYLVGVVKKAYPTHCVVSSILDPDFSVSAYDINTKELSYVTGDAKIALQGMCKFENLDTATKITYGSIIATAGISSTMPKDIVIGTVKEISDEETNISTYAMIEPGTDISKLDYCLVLTGYSGESEAE